MFDEHFPFSGEVGKDQNHAGHRNQNKSHLGCIQDSVDFPTNFARTIATCPPEVPPELLRLSEFQSQDAGRNVCTISFLFLPNSLPPA